MNLLKYQQIPYKWAGRSFDGADCYGLLVLWFRNELGIELYDCENPTSYKALSGASTFASGSEQEWIKVPEDQIKTHDGVLICNGSLTPNHCGIVINPREFIQLLENSGCHTALIRKWRPRIYGFYRHKGLL